MRIRNDRNDMCLWFTDADALVMAMWKSGEFSTEDYHNAEHEIARLTGEHDVNKTFWQGDE
jgi:hypothetical protein